MGGKDHLRRFGGQLPPASDAPAWTMTGPALDGARDVERAAHREMLALSSEPKLSF